MSDYERGIRDAMEFYFTHSVEVSGASSGTPVSRVVQASPKALDWCKDTGQKQLMTDAAISALVKTEAAR